MTSGIQFDPEAIRALAQILKDTDLSEIELVEKDSRIRVARSIQAPPPFAWPAGVAAPPFAAFPAGAPGGGAVPAVSADAAAGGVGFAASAAAAPSSAETVDPKHPGLIASPMVGVVYLWPEPGAGSFVTVDSMVA